jgi:F-type H+-transporting ATPase subunit O
LSADERSKVISSLTSGATSPILANLLEVLAQNGRLPLTRQVIEDFHTLMAAHKNELTVTVTTAEPLSASSKEMTRLEKAIKGSKIAEGKVVKIVNKVNPSILGGMMVDFGDKTIDLTASSKVTRYSAAIAGESRG